MSITNSPQSLRFAYAHGFGSGPKSTKGVQLAELMRGRGEHFELPDLRVPSLGGLRLGAMIDVLTAFARVAGEGKSIVIGSSLGALATARAAERDSRIAGVLLLAPAFCLVERWHRRLGDAAWSEWQRTGTMTYPDYSDLARSFDLEFAFVEDCARIDGPDVPLDAEALEGRGPRWPNITVPVTIIHGRNDVTVDPELSRIYSKNRPNVRLVEIDDDHQMLASMPIIVRELDALVGRVVTTS